MINFVENYLCRLKDVFYNPEFELRVLLNNSSKNKKEIFLNNFDINNINIQLFNQAFNRRIKKEPISKIFNIKSFWKHDFYVNTDVLDPRPETELIIDQVLKNFPKKNSYLKILDMCTGSGCIAISLAKEYLNAELTATDISDEALTIAKINAKKLNCFSRINFVKCDLLEQLSTYDIIVSNPPYLSKYEYQNTSLEILLYEPKIALIADKEGYEYYYKIANILPNLLDRDSKVFLEIGISQAKKAIDIFKSKKINCLNIAKDIQNIDRVLILNKS